MKDQEFNFENAFSRLEEILEKMNTGNVSLDESLKLFEEADKLICASTTRLNAVEEKIENLIKRRNGELVLDEEGLPLRQTFYSENNDISKQDQIPVGS